MRAKIIKSYVGAPKFDAEQLQVSLILQLESGDEVRQHISLKTGSEGRDKFGQTQLWQLMSDLFNGQIIEVEETEYNGKKQYPLKKRAKAPAEGVTALQQEVAAATSQATDFAPASGTEALAQTFGAQEVV